MPDQTAAVRLTESDPVAKGFNGLACPLCGDRESVQSLHLDDCATFTCAACSDDYGVADVRAFFAAWTPMLSWLDTAPAISE